MGMERADCLQMRAAVPQVIVIVLSGDATPEAVLTPSTRVPPDSSPRPRAPSSWRRPCAGS
jgi:hypothetical protein